MGFNFAGQNETELSHNCLMQKGKLNTFLARVTIIINLFTPLNISLHIRLKWLLSVQ